MAVDGADDGNPMSDPQSPCCPVATNNSRPSRKERQIRQKSANRARHKLLSIRHDVETIVQPFLEKHEYLRHLTLIANERCGSWYAPQFHESCYFKSTDGHVGTWNLSLKRLNLNVIDSISRNGQGCLILDASVHKELPDSFSRTIPMWAACMNRIAARYREELGIIIDEPIGNWDCNLYTPSWVVSEEEHKTMEDLIDTRVQELYKSQAIVDPCWLGSILKKPLRPYWISSPLHMELPTVSDDWYAIILLNCSEHHPNPIWKENKSFWYTPGAADDHELWARQLSPRLFWDNVALLLDTRCQGDDETDQVIATIVQKARHENQTFEEEGLQMQSLFNGIGETNLFIGTRRAGRPPDCWNHFDAVLNVTDLEYPDIIHKGGFVQDKFYVQLPVKEGKRDRTELERWMAVGIVFCVFHARHNRRILIHCAQGKDRSVAVAMATIVLFCDWTFPLRWNDAFWNISLQDLIDTVGGDPSNVPHDCHRYQSSGLPNHLVCGLLGWKGRDHFFQWVCKELPSDSHLATKETLRIVLHLIKQNREKADPTRSTMQKLNRFFMSSNNHPN